MSSYRIEVKPIESLTRAIGYVCVFWAWLEDDIGEMILDLAPLDKRTLTKKEIEQIRDVILVDTDIRTKIKILRAVAFIRKWEKSWFAQVDKVLNKIDNDIRPRRNRVVHGMWFAPKGRLERQGKFARLKRPQAFAEEELATRERVPVKMREIWNLGRDIIAAQTRLIGLYLRHEAIQKHIDGDIHKQVANAWMREIGSVIRENPALLPALLAISVQQDVHPKSPGTRRKNKRSKRSPPQQSPRG
jgi:hypothetical protein